ncbi:MAG: hypothetical protein WD904_02830 [Dehalococcoidia bacterium]
MTKYFRAARHWVWIAPIVLGVAFIAGGVFMIMEGRSAHDDVRDSVVQEGIIVSEDAPAFGGEQVDSPAKADAQAEAILHHTLAATGGYLYAEIGRFSLPEGNYMLPNGTYAAPDGGVTTDVALAATDDDGNPIITTTDETLAAKNASDQPVVGWTNNSELAAKDANGAPVQNALRNTAKDSAFLRTSLGVATMGFKVADLVVGLGLFLAVLGAMNVFIISPVTYWATVVADEHERTRKTAAAEERVRGPQTT